MQYNHVILHIFRIIDCYIAAQNYRHHEMVIILTETVSRHGFIVMAAIMLWSITKGQRKFAFYKRIHGVIFLPK